MAKESMNIRYKSKKRERNKNNPTMTKNDALKSTLRVFVGVAIFLGLMYLCVIGMEKLGVFESSYTLPSKKNNIDYEFINVKTVFNRADASYFVMFDNYSSNYSYDLYVDELLSKIKTPVYKVDMSKKENNKYSKEKGNSKAKTANELKINGRTLIKISNGRIKDYIEGSANIEEYLK